MNIGSMMEEEGGGGGGGGGGGWARGCDSCRSAPSAVYCRADAAYLCAACDGRVHEANWVASRHERVWVCEVCEQAPAAFTCQADAAALCAACDADVHSANPLSRRHHRVPVLPIQSAAAGRRRPAIGLPAVSSFEAEQEEGEKASWLLVDPAKRDGNQGGAGYMSRKEVVKFLDFEEYNCGEESQKVLEQQQQQQQHKHNNQEGSECVVPAMRCLAPIEQQHHHQYQMETDQYAPPSHSVSMSSLDTSVMPDTAMTDISNSHARQRKGTIELFAGTALQMHQFTPMDREARVLRYREKRKMRKFEKTIRYASRKAYAETRPRIKGRFAKRTDIELEVDQVLSASVISDGGYGIVPSF